MVVYRITLAIHAAKLVASGSAARWNSKDVKVIYAASSRSLACLENIVHRNSKGLDSNFRVISIEIPDSVSIEVVEKDKLPTDWRDFYNYHHTQGGGDEWTALQRSAVLKVPSVIIPDEYNYLLNPAHKAFKKIKLISSEVFEFDRRLKE